MTPFTANAWRGGEAPREGASSSESRITAVHIEADVIPDVISSHAPPRLLPRVPRMIREQSAAPTPPPSIGLRPVQRASIVRLLASALAADLRDFVSPADTSGVSRSGHARREPRAVVGQLHPLLAALASST